MAARGQQGRFEETRGGLRRGRRLATMLAPVLAAGGMAIVGAPAEAALERMGPIDPDTGFPGWYADSTGLGLQLCLDGPPNCLATRADLLEAGVEGEGFWFAADATAGKVDAHLAVEAAYFGVDQPIAFQRSQFDADGLVPGATYVITDPWGQHECEGETTRDRTRCRFEVGSTFETALDGPIGPFLTWDTFGTTGPAAPPVGYIGDNTTPHRVVGSPTGFNRLRVEGPGVNDSGADLCPTVDGPETDCAETDLFVIQGKVAPGPAARADVSTLDLGNVGGAVTRSVSFTSVGTQGLELGVPTVSGPGASSFDVTDNGCGVAVAPGESCTLHVTYTPTRGEQAAATLAVADQAGTVRTVRLRGSSVAVAGLSRTVVQMGKRKMRTGPSRPKTVVVRNTGVAPLALQRIRSTSRDFRVATACPATLPAAQSCAVRVRFAPRATGRRGADLVVATDAGTQRSALMGTGTRPAMTMPRSVAHGRVAVGRQRAHTVRLRNTGDAVLVVGGRRLQGPGKAHFRLGGSAVEPCRHGLRVRPGSFCSVVVRFAPRARGLRRASLVVRGDGLRRTVRLSGRGVR